MDDGRNKKRIKLGVQIQNLLDLFGKFHWKNVSSEQHFTQTYISFIHSLF
jgi:hypothetical protein